MGGNREEALAQVQAEAANTQIVQKHHKFSLLKISERNFTYLFGLAFIGIVIDWLNCT